MNERELARALDAIHPGLDAWAMGEAAADEAGAQLAELIDLDCPQEQSTSC